MFLIVLITKNIFHNKNKLKINVSDIIILTLYKIINKDSFMYKLALLLKPIFKMIVVYTHQHRVSKNSTSFLF